MCKIPESDVSFVPFLVSHELASANLVDNELDTQ